ncbi:MAG: phosphatase PAP2 family protein [Bacteroidales bacterium]|jgi:undecaprenyl-diphosphatase
MQIIESIKELDELLFLWLNSIRSSALDFVMWHFTKYTFWIPLFIILFYIIVKRFRKYSILIFIMLGVLILINDQFCNLSKYLFMRLRPTHEGTISSIVNTVNGYRGGLYSFYSGHASNTFAVVTFFSLIFKNKPKYLFILLWTFAVITVFSRIYLGVHYPGDIIVGAIVGTLFGFLVYKAFREIYFHFTKQVV